MMEPIEGDLRIVVRPDDRALIFKWHWSVQEWRLHLHHPLAEAQDLWGDSDDYGWYLVFTGWNHVKGSKRTQAAAMTRAHKAVATICEHRLEQSRREEATAKATVIERVTCAGS